MMHLRAGQSLDRYQLLRPLGSGGQAQVWQAYDPLPTGGHVALKLVDASRASEASLERARREARMLVGLSHPGLVRHHRLLEEEGVGLVLVMDLAEGVSLDQLLDDPRMTVHHREGVLRHVAGALAHLHAAGIVHRDLKPQNVVVSERFWQEPAAPGLVKLVDLGISVRIGNPTPLTQEGRTIGTPAFMAPERIVPLSPGQGLLSTPQTDVFAWGIFAWQVLVGGHPTGLPLDASLADFAAAYLSARQGLRPWPVHPLHHPWTPLLVGCLQIAPEQRPTDANEISRCLWAPASSSSRYSIQTDVASTAAPPPSLAPPSLAPSTLTPRPGAVWSTEPGFRPSYPSTEPAPLIPPPPPSPPASGALPWGLGLPVFCTTVFGGLFALVITNLDNFLLQRPAVRPPAVVTTPAPTVRAPNPSPLPPPTATGQPTPAPRSPWTPSPQEPTCPCDVQRSSRDCASGRSLVRGYGCTEELPPSNAYSLRFSYASTRDKQSLRDRDPDARLRVCKALSTKECTSYDISGNCRKQIKLRVTIRDLLAGLVVEYLDAYGKVRERVTVKHAAINASALCAGLRFGVSPDSSALLKDVSFFLDED